MKTLLNIFDTTCPFQQGNLLILTNKFEVIVNDAFQRVKSETYKDEVFYKFLQNVFYCIDLKLNKKAIGNKEFNTAKLDSLHLQSKSVDCNQYEPFMLKVKCVMEALQLVQVILRIENVYYVKKKLVDSIGDDD